MFKNDLDNDMENFSFKDYNEEATGKKYIEMLENANQNKTDDYDVDDNNLQDDDFKIDDPVEKSKKADEKEEFFERKYDKYTS